MEKRPFLLSRSAEISAAILLALALAEMQVLIGGTRLAFSLPVDAVLVVVGVLSVLVAQPKPAASRVALISAAVFFGYVLARAWFSPVPAIARVDIFSVLGGLIVYFFTACIFTAAPRRIYLFLFLLLVALGQVIIGAIQFRSGDNFMLIPFLQRFDYGRRASGFYVCPNHFAGLLEVLGIFALSLVFWGRWPVWAKLLLGYAAGVCYVGLALTGSRGGYLSATASLLVLAGFTLAVLRQAGRAIFWRTALAGAVVALLMAGALFVGFNNSRLLSSRAQNIVDTQNMRLELWRGALAQWKTAPLLGTGSGTYLYYGRRFRTPAVQLDPVEVHNDYLHLLAEYGVVGGAAFLLFLGAHLRSGWRGFQRLGPRRVAASLLLPSNSLALNLGAFGALGAYLVHSGFDFNLHIPANVLLLAFVFGLLANPALERKPEPNATPSRWNPGRLILPVLAVLLALGCWRYLRAELYAEKARSALRDERHVAAMLWANRALALDRQNPVTWFYLGESRVRRAENAFSPAARDSFSRAAIEPFTQALALAPNDETFQIALGRVYDSLGRFAEAEAMFGAARAWDPRSDVVQKSYAAHLALWKGERAPAPAPLQLPDPNAPIDNRAAPSPAPRL
ncbi:MAG: O-antigen ligase family protein [Chthoniobacterales bacterium]